MRKQSSQGWFFEIDCRILLELRDWVKDFVFPCISRPMTKASSSPYNISLVEDRGMLWTPSKQKFIEDIDLKQNSSLVFDLIEFF